MSLEAFTTAALVRVEAGFTNNALITDPIIEPHVISANAEIEGCVSAKYNVPLSINTNYSGSYAENFLKGLATQLAASELSLQQFEGQGGDLIRMAQSKIDLVREKLAKLKSGSLHLLDTEGVELSLKEAALRTVKGFPKNSNLTEPDEPTTVEPVVTMGERF